MFRFANPWYLLLLIAVVGVAWRIYSRRVGSGILFAPTQRVIAAGTTWRIRVAGLLPILFLLGLVLLVLALARPQTVLSKTRRPSEAIAIGMALDVSGSMEALDMSDIVNNEIKTERTRLDMVKATFADFVEKRPNDLIGLVTFGGYASTRAPLTLDHKALLHVLKGVEIPKYRLGDRGLPANEEELMTAIGDGLATACARMEDAEPKSRIIVLLSDGEHNTGIIRPEQAIEIAKELNIKVYTIGVGSTGTSFVRNPLMGGRIQRMHVRLDEKLLKKIATETSGKYFNVQDPEGLDEVMDEIDELEKTEVNRAVYSRYNELFHLLLGPSLGLLALAIGLNVLITRRIA